MRVSGLFDGNCEQRPSPRRQGRPYVGSQALSSDIMLGWHAADILIGSPESVVAKEI